MTLNEPDDLEIRVSEKKLQILGAVLLGLALIFAVIGAIVSPTDEQGRPVLLLPEVRAIETYRQVARSWTADLADLDGEISDLLAATARGDLLSQAQAAQRTLEHAVRLVQQIDRTPVPPVGMGLHEKLRGTAFTYLEAARSALQWVSAPVSGNREEASQYLQSARHGRQELEENSWMTAP